MPTRSQRHLTEIQGYSSAGNSADFDPGTILAFFGLGSFGYANFTLVAGPQCNKVNIYRTPSGVPLDKNVHPKTTHTVSPGNNTISIGDTSIKNILANPNFSDAAPPPTLGRGWSIVGGQLQHAIKPAGAMTSSDGVTWTLQETPHDATVELKWFTCCWAGPPKNLFVAVSNDGALNRQIMTSPDGITWTPRTVPENQDINSVAYSPTLGMFVAVGFTAGPSGSRMMSSLDGITWTTIADVDTGALAWRDICWSPERGIFCACGSTNSATATITSPDGVNWVRRGSAGQGQWQSIIYANNMAGGIFVIVGNSGVFRIATAANPVSAGFVGVTTPWDATLALRGLAYSPTLNRLIAVANTGTVRVITSTDGTNWTDITANIPSGDVLGWADVEWCGDKFVATPGGSQTDAGVATSPDGLTWTWQRGAPIQSWKSICYSPDLNRIVVTNQAENFHADYSLWPTIGTVPGEAWRGYANVLSITPNWGDFTLRFTEAASVVASAYDAEEIVLSAVVPGTVMGRKVITYDRNDNFTAGAQPSTGVSVDNLFLFKETPACLPQGIFDFHAFPVTQYGVEGAVSVASVSVV